MTTLPTIHLNGSSPDELLGRLEEALSAVFNARNALSFTAPNGRDYYPQGDDALRAAIAEHDSRSRRLREVQEELQVIAEYVADERDRRKR